LYGEFFYRSEWFDVRAQSPAYSPSDQTKILYQEIRESIIREYRPYVGWSRRPFKGNLVNINEEGDRVTRYNSARDDALQIWVFGGSTVWGFGVPDSETIPSYLAALLNDEWVVDTTVRNMGEGAFVSTQDVARLILELQQAKRPDVVVIYGGVNDVYAGTYSPGVPGAVQNQDQISSRVEGRDIWGRWIRSLGLYRAPTFVLGKVGINTNVALLRANSVAELELRIRALKTADIWLQNYQVVSTLAGTYGFDLVMALQPNLFISGKPLREYEREMLTDMERSQPVFVQGTRLAYSAIQDRLGSGDYERIYDFTDAFNAIPSPLYIDEIHVTGTGNQRLAEMLYDAVHTQLCANIPNQASQYIKDQIRARCTGVSQNRPLLPSPSDAIARESINVYYK
jgi:lysophospholipase L1-like esterase